MRRGVIGDVVDGDALDARVDKLLYDAAANATRRARNESGLPFELNHFSPCKPEAADSGLLWPMMITAHAAALNLGKERQVSEYVNLRASQRWAAGGAVAG